MLGIVVFGTKAISSVGLGIMASKALKTAVPVGMGIYSKICVGTSISVVACMIEGKMFDYLDETATLIKETIETIKNRGQEKEIRKRLEKIKKL